MVKPELGGFRRNPQKRFRFAVREGLSIGGGGRQWGPLWIFDFRELADFRRELAENCQATVDRLLQHDFLYQQDHTTFQ